MARPAPTTIVANLGRHVVADFQVLHVLANFDNRAANLVPGYDGQRASAPMRHVSLGVRLHPKEVRAADRRNFRLNYHLVGT